MRRGLDRINQRAFTSRRALKVFAALSGWIDPGEEVAIRHAIAKASNAESRNLRILDIGIGAGRTIPMMLDVSSSYVGIDVAPKLLAIASERFPDLDLRIMDARALEFDGGSFDLVAFSYAGIDAVDLQDRLGLLAEVRRVLAPDGLFIFSALNRDGPSHAPRLSLSEPRGHRSPVSELLRAARTAIENTWNYWRYKRLNHYGRDISVSTLAAHSFGVVAIFTSVPEQVRQLREAGFNVAAIYDSVSGSLVAPDQHETQSAYLHYVAGKTPDSGPYRSTI